MDCDGSIPGRKAPLEEATDKRVAIPFLFILVATLFQYIGLDLGGLFAIAIALFAAAAVLVYAVTRVPR
jgi:hypothetical protein